MDCKSAIILASALCFFSFFTSSFCQDSFLVKGSVYCDTCRAGFITKLSHPLKGATVRLECSDPVDSKNVTFRVEKETDASGMYSVEVEGDHQDEVCEVSLVKSSDPGCSEVDTSPYLKQAARISITHNNGIVSSERNPNPLYFLQKEPLAKCAGVWEELGLRSDGFPVDDNL